MSRRLIASIVLAYLATGCSQRDKKPRLSDSAVVGDWQTAPDDSSAERAGRRYRLRIRSDGMAEFVRLEQGRDSMIERGTWDGADSLLRVVVRRDGPGARPNSMLLAIRGDRLGLVQSDSAAWGTAGFELRRTP